MAVYRLSATIVKRSAGQSACAAAAYRAGCTIEDERTGQTHDYTRKRGIEHSEIMVPESAPDWARDRERLWNAAETAEKRKDAQLAREILLSLPHELNADQRRELVRDYVRQEYVEKRQLAADIAIHDAHRQGDERNRHAHVLLTLRKMEADGLARKKERSFNDKEGLLEERRQWADYQNEALARAGLDMRVDHRSLEERGINREPEPKLGPVATKMEREGRTSHAGDDLRAAWQRNKERAQLEEQQKVISLEIERERRRAAQEQKAPQRGAEKAVIGPDGYARGSVEAEKLEQPDSEALAQQRQGAALRGRVAELEGQIEGRSRAAILWDKLRGRMAWSAERDLVTARQALSAFQAQTAAQFHQDAPRQVERPQSADNRSESDKMPLQVSNRDSERQQSREKEKNREAFSAAALEEKREADEVQQALREQRREFYRQQLAASREREGLERDL